MSGSFRIELNRSRAIAVSVCLLAAGILLFAAGTVSGLLLSAASIRSETAKAEAASAQYKRILAAEAKAPTPAAAPALPASDTGASTETQSANPPALAALPSAPQATTPVAAPSQSPQPTPSPAPTAPSPSGAPVYAIGNAPTTTLAAQSASSSAADSAPLAVKVCSFAGKSSAENLVAELDAKGYRASIMHSVGAHGRMWYVVILGPYKEWNSATEVAARVAVAENVRPVVGQIP